MVEPDPHVVQQWQLLFIRIYTMWYNLVQLNAQDLVNFDVFSGGGAIYNAFSSTPSLLFQSHSMRFEVQNLHWMLTLGRKTNEEKAAMLRRSLSFSNQSVLCSKLGSAMVNYIIWYISYNAKPRLISNGLPHVEHRLKYWRQTAMMWFIDPRFMRNRIQVSLLANSGTKGLLRNHTPGASEWPHNRAWLLLLPTENVPYKLSFILAPLIFSPDSQLDPPDAFCEAGLLWSHPVGLTTSSRWFDDPGSTMWIVCLDIFFQPWPGRTETLWFWRQGVGQHRIDVTGPKWGWGGS